jgi:hypothetical protein
MNGDHFEEEEKKAEVDMHNSIRQDNPADEIPDEFGEENRPYDHHSHRNVNMVKIIDQIYFHE